MTVAPEPTVAQAGGGRKMLIVVAIAGMTGLAAAILGLVILNRDKEEPAPRNELAETMLSNQPTVKANPQRPEPKAAKERSDAENFRHQEQLAAAGDVAAMRRLGICYATGLGVAKNNPKAFEWVDRAAQAGDGEAMYCLSNYYRLGVGVRPNLAAAKEWRQKSAQAGYKPPQQVAARRPDPKSQAGYNTWRRPDPKNQAGFYARRRPDPKIEAFQNYERLAAGGDTKAMGNLGRCYAQGWGTPKDLHKAVEAFRRGTDGGNGWCMHELGVAYALGNGVAQDWAQAFAWFQRGADAGHPDSMNDLAVCYYHGNGTPVNKPLAQQWLGKAAKAGSSQARKNLNGKGLLGVLSSKESMAAMSILSGMGQIMGPPNPAQQEADRQFEEDLRRRRDAERDAMERNR